MDLLKTVFGIDVSSRKSNVCIMVNGQKVNDYAISNDMVGFNRLLGDLKQVTKPQIIFEATGVYSRRLQAFLDMHELRYVMMNPLEAKRKTKDDLHQNKTDKLDALYLAKLQSEHPQRLAYVQNKEYQELMANNRIYEQASHDLITNKNRLHKAVQLTFPEIEHLLANPRGKNYWSIALRFPHPDIVLETKEADIIDFLKGLSGIGKKRANDITQNLIRLAKVACPAVKKNSAHIRGLKMAINNILSAEEECQTALQALQEMAKLAPKRDLEILTSIPGIGENTALRIISELGDIRRFNNPSQLNAFVGVDPQVYESGNLTAHLSISKRGTAIGRKVLYLAINQIQSAKKAGKPCHIADYYEKRKRSSETASHKKAAIASIHKLLRTIFALIKNDQLYSYDVAKHNQRLLS
ncbi:IS110 family transposase [Lactobacillus delbrueckii subsp. bulgaricus]|uniref:IS110 family transposase n=7 Tax=Lactobacillus delbrueckii TaxID=1584 RepID=UPI0011532C68|nr:IS110 family transposase [Lactobacillus delbrueckii]QDH98038.1 IS110 family transposase [Lactobacillus delbrueckii subsp. bulgaricus]